MTDLEKQMLDDLERKLRDDIGSAIMRFLKLCRVAELDYRDSLSAMLGTLMTGTVEFSAEFGVPRETVLEQMDRYWRHTTNERPRERS